MAKVVGKVDFENEVLKSDIPVMVDFFAEWCVPCRMIAPAIEELSLETAGHAKIVKVDIDEASEIAYKYGIRSVPTLMFFKNGEPVDRIVGTVPKATLKEKIIEIRG